MDGRPPEVTDIVNGETFKLACMACIRGHRTKHCGSVACREKVLWTIKRPGRPSNSCQCKFSGITGRCKCVIAKAQCPHKVKKGEKRSEDCRCDERGRLCCTLSAGQWQMVALGFKPAVKFFRSQEELHFSLTGTAVLPSATGSSSMMLGQSPMSTPQTPAASLGGFTNGSGGSTPQTPVSTPYYHTANVYPHPLPHSPTGPPRARFGMMGIGAPLGSEGDVGQDVLSWQGQTPIAPAPRQAYAPPTTYASMPPVMQPPFPQSGNIQIPYNFDHGILQPALLTPHHQESPRGNHAQAQTPGSHLARQPVFDGVPPVTTSFGELSMATAETLPALSGFDMDYFNFQFPGAICQQCGMADCTCRSCPTVLQNTMDGSWQQCCSRKHVFAGSLGATDVSAGQSAKKGCCGAKVTARADPVKVEAPEVSEARSTGGCCAGSSSREVVVDDDLFDFGVAESRTNGLIPHVNGTAPTTSGGHVPAFDAYHSQPGVEALLFDHNATPAHSNHLNPTVLQVSHEPFPHTFDPPAQPLGYDNNAKYQAVPSWPLDTEHMDMDFDAFVQQEQGGCGCGSECPCGMDDSLDLDLEMEMELGGDDERAGASQDAGGGATGGGPLTIAVQRSCCGDGVG